MVVGGCCMGMGISDALVCICDGIVDWGSCIGGDEKIGMGDVKVGIFF